MTAEGATTAVPSKPVGFDLERLRVPLAERGLGALLLTSPENVYYTTGFPALPTAGNPILYTLRNRLPFFAYVEDTGRVVLLCWWFAAVGMEFGTQEVRGFDSVRTASDALIALLKERAAGGRPLAVESSCPVWVAGLVEEATGRVPLFLADEVVADLRLIKSEAEIALIAESTRIIERTMTELFDQIRVGMSRLELIREAKARAFRYGATGISHATFSFGTANPEIAIDEPLEPGRLITLDLGVFYNGYASDTRRYGYAGTVHQPLRERHRLMLEIVDEIGEALLPGTPFSSLYQRALDLYAAHGLEARFSRAGHNIGLETEEAWLSKDERRTVAPGMVINVELYSTIETGEQIGNEETYVIGAEGPTRISRLPREIREIV